MNQVSDVKGLHNIRLADIVLAEEDIDVGKTFYLEIFNAFEALNVDAFDFHGQVIGRIIGYATVCCC